ncbi:MAG: YgcG family protein [Methylobacter sp.]|nr:MAG: YgcG family protein [Methylobacter sp.]
MLSAIFPRIRYGLGFFLLLFCMSTWAVVGVPELSRRVTDLTATLSPAQLAALEDKLAVFETKKGSQIAVLIVSSTQPKDIAEFGIEVADLSQIGRKGVDDGVILIVAKDDRKLRLEVGYGLEGVIPDAVAKRIIAETITPYFKKNDYAGGIDAGVMQLMQLIDGEALSAPPASLEEDKQNEQAFMFVLVGGVLAGSVLSAIVGSVISGMLAGLASGMVAVLVLGLTIKLALIVGLLVFFIVEIHYVGRGGWSSGGGSGSSGSLWGGGGFGSGSSSGSSWSGGGGGFGGGGASGSW